MYAFGCVCEWMDIRARVCVNIYVWECECINVWVVNLLSLCLLSIDFMIIYTNLFASMYIVQCTMYIVYCTMYIVYCTMYIVYCTLNIVHCTLYIVHCTLYIVHCTLYIVHCTLYIVHCTLYIVHCTLYKWLAYK